MRWKWRWPICANFLPVLPIAVRALGATARHRPRASCGWAAGSAAIVTAIRTSPPTRCAWRWARSSQAVLADYLERLHALGAELSISSELAAVTEAVIGAGGGERRHQSGARDEPYRRAITGFYARLAATYQEADRPRAAAAGVGERRAVSGCREPAHRSAGARAIAGGAKHAAGSGAAARWRD